MTAQPAPVLIGCAHGTKSPAGRQIVRDLLDEVRLALPGVDVREAYVDVHGPWLTDVIADVPVAAEGRAAVVVPLLVAGGYHVYHDIANAIEDRPDVVSAPALGPDERLATIVLDRLRDAGAAPDSTLVLAAAGSSDDRANAATEAAGEMLRERWAGPVHVAFAAGRSPSVVDMVRQARDEDGAGAVAVASFLLAPGVFQSRLLQAGADVVTAPLAPHPELVSIVIDRYSSLIHD